MGGLFLILALASSPLVKTLHGGSGETPALVTKLLRPVQLLQEEQAVSLGTPLASSEDIHSSRHWVILCQWKWGIASPSGPTHSKPLPCGIISEFMKIKNMVALIQGLMA